MRVVFAASFVDDADAIARYIERHGALRADAFIDDLNRFCELVATQPRLGRQNHGYHLTLYGVVHDMNWIFFEHDLAEVRFIHIVDWPRERGRVLNSEARVANRSLAELPGVRGRNRRGGREGRVAERALGDWGLSVTSPYPRASPYPPASP